ncbi:MAG: hypothetical protein ACE361_20170 [Aureliella sp.]
MLPHFNSLRQETNLPDLVLSSDESANTLIYVTNAASPKEDIESAILRWIEPALQNRTITPAADSTTTSPPSIIVPPENELRKRFVWLRRLYPEMYRYLKMPSSNSNIAADISR